MNAPHEPLRPDSRPSLGLATAVALVAGAATLAVVTLVLWQGSEATLSAIDFNAALFEDFLGPYWQTAGRLAAGETTPSRGYLYPSTIGWLVAPWVRVAGVAGAEAAWATAAATAMIVLSLGVLIASIFALVQPSSLRAAAAFGAVLFVGHATVHGAYWAQASLPAIAATVAGFALLRTDRPRLAGFSIGLGCALKLHPGVALIALLLHRSTKPAAMSFLITVAAAGILLPMALMGLDGFVEFHRVAFARLAEMGDWVMTQEGGRGAQDVPALVVRLGGAPLLGRAIGAALALGVVGASIATLRSSGDEVRPGQRYLKAFVLVAAIPWVALSPTWPHGLLWVPASWWLAANGSSVVARTLATLSFLAGSIFALRVVGSPGTYAFWGLPALSAALAVMTALLTRADRDPVDDARVLP